MSFFGCSQSKDARSSAPASASVAQQRQAGACRHDVITQWEERESVVAIQDEPVPQSAVPVAERFFRVYIVSRYLFDVL